MFLRLISCLLLALNVNCNQWDGYHRQLDDALPPISSWKDCGISSRKSDPTANIPEVATDVSSRIQNGEYAQYGEFPWFVGLEVEFETAGGTAICGGSIINEWWVLTAAHCVDKDFKPEVHWMNVTAVIGSLQTNAKEEGYVRRIDIERVVIHHKYIEYYKQVLLDREDWVKKWIKLDKWEKSGREKDTEYYELKEYVNKTGEIIKDQFRHTNRMGYDIALLKLKDKIIPVFNETHYIINSICLPKTGIFNTDNENVMIIGMGTYNPPGKDKDPEFLRLKKAINLLAKNSECPWMVLNGAPGPMACHYLSNDTRRTSVPLSGTPCEGDSGSPSHQYFGSKAVQIGLTSMGWTTKDGTQCGEWVSYTRISLFMPWIREVLELKPNIQIKVKSNYLLIFSVIVTAIIGVSLGFH